MSSSAVLICVLAVAVVAFLAREVYGRVAAARAARESASKAQADAIMAAMDGHAKAMADLSESVARWSASMDSMPQYIKGLVEVCERSVVQYEAASESVRSLSQLLTVKPQERQRETGFEAYSDEAADLSYLKQAYMARGMPEDEAIEKARADQEKKILDFPTILD